MLKVLLAWTYFRQFSLVFTKRVQEEGSNGILLPVLFMGYMALKNSNYRKCPWVKVQRVTVYPKINGPTSNLSCQPIHTNG